MDRRTFLKAVGASLAGCMLPAVLGPAQASGDVAEPARIDPDDIYASLHNRLKKRLDGIKYWVTSTPSALNSFYDQCVIEGQSSANAIRGERAKKVYFKGVELHYEPRLDTEFYMEK